MTDSVTVPKPLLQAIEVRDCRETPKLLGMIDPKPDAFRTRRTQSSRRDRTSVLLGRPYVALCLAAEGALIGFR
jgi:hypothetical protein